MKNGRKSTPAPATVAPTTKANKSDAIRTYAAEHPEAKAKDIAAALTAAGVEVSAGRVSGVLRQGKATKSATVNVEAVKSAAAFVTGFGGSVEDALTAIETVGKFVDLCKSSAKAKAALEAYQALSAALNGK
jgi:putative heme degradation protein